MKTKILSPSLALLTGVAVLAHVSVAWAEPASAATSGKTTLSYGAGEVLKLAQAKVNDDTIVAFIDGGHGAYSLSADEILKLREQGVSDRVLSAMLTHQKETAQAASQIAPTAPAISPAPGQTQYPGGAVAAPAPTIVQPATTTYVQSAPVYVPSSTVYVAPSAPLYYDYGYYPYFGVPRVSLSFGFGGFRGGGWHGGGFRGGGFHGGFHGHR